MRSLKLGSKLLLGGTFIVVVSVLTIGTLSYHRATIALEAASRHEALTKASDLADTAQLILSEKLKVIEQLTVAPTVVDVSRQRAREGENLTAAAGQRLTGRLSQSLKMLGDDYEEVFVADAGGRIFSSARNAAQNGISVADRDYFGLAAKGKMVIGKPVKSRATGNAVIVIAGPVGTDPGEPLGIIAVVLKLEKFMKNINETRIGETGYAFVIDGEGMMIAHPKSELVFTLNLKGQKGMERIIEQMIAKKSGVESYNFDGKEKIAGFAPIALTGWSICVTQDRDEFMKPVAAIRQGSVLVGCVLLLFSIAVTMLFSRRITRPITKVIEGLTESSLQLAAASGQISTASNFLADRTSRQASSIEETSSSLEELSAMTKQNAHNAGQANQLMAVTRETVLRANGSMEKLVVSMGEISRASEETSKIIKTIDEIAFQTNLLALNAAVEAARAGESGAGFAVVADEVRNLAMRAAEAAKNTSSLIEGTIGRIREGCRMVEKTGAEFVEVAGSSEKMRDLVGEISAASSEQAQGIELINKAMNSVGDVVQQNAASAEETASASEEMSSQAGQMKVFVEELISLVGGAKTQSNQLRNTGREKVIEKFPAPTPGEGLQPNKSGKTNGAGEMRIPFAGKADKSFAQYRSPGIENIEEF